MSFANELANELPDNRRSRPALVGTLDYVCPGQTLFLGIQWFWSEGFGRPLKVVARVQIPYGVLSSITSESPWDAWWLSTFERG